MKRILGIDYGTKYIGFALGDPFTQIAMPLDVVNVEGKDPVKVVWAMVQEDGYDHIVIGSPLTSDGESTEMSERVDEFARSVGSVTGIEVSLVSEHLTSKVSDQLSDEVGSARHDDALAAMLIVQEFLNGL